MKTYSQANRGRPFEEFLAFVHAKYQRTGIACVHKVPTEFIPLRDASGKVCSVKVEHKSCVDYLGRYKGTPVAIEAKHTESGRIRWDRVEDHQAEYLDDFCKDPAAVGIVIVSFNLRRFFAVPWLFWRDARNAWNCMGDNRNIKITAYGWTWETKGMASVTPDRLLPAWEIKTGGTTGLPYLDIIDRMKGDRA